MAPVSRNPGAEPGWGTAVLLVGLLTLWHVVESAASPFNLSFDEAQYWDWSRHLAFGYFSKPPVVAWAIAATTALFGQAEWAVRMGSPLAHAATALALFVLGRDLASPRTGVLAALVFATLPGVSLSAMLISTDPFLMAAWAWGLVALRRALAAEDEGRPALAAWLATGLALGAGMLSKYAMIAFAGGAVLAMAWEPAWRGLWRRPGPWIALGLGALVFSPNLAWNAHHAFVSLAHTRANANLHGGGLHPLNALAFLGSQFVVFGPIPMVLLGVAVFGLRRRLAAADGKQAADLRFLAAFVLPLILVMTLEGLLSRANANWAAPAYVAASLWVVSEAVRAHRVAWLKAAVVLHLLAALAMVNFDGITHALGVELAARTDPAKRVRGWDRMGEALGATLRGLPADRMPVLAFDSRKILTPMLYYLPRPRPVIAKWNGDGRIEDHYDLTADLAAQVGREVWLVTRAHDVSAYAPAFSGPVQGPVVLSVPIRRDYVLSLRVYRMGTFLGYPPDAPKGGGADKD